MESGFQPSLYPNFHHQLVLAKFDLSIYYSPSYERTHPSIILRPDLIRRTIDLFDWDKKLHFNDVDNQVAVFSDTLNTDTVINDKVNIIQNFIPN